jgi:hypothetical protein
LKLIWAWTWVKKSEIPWKVRVFMIILLFNESRRSKLCFLLAVCRGLSKSSHLRLVSLSSSQDLFWESELWDSSGSQSHEKVPFICSEELKRLSINCELEIAAIRWCSVCPTTITTGLVALKMLEEQ